MDRRRPASHRVNGSVCDILIANGIIDDDGWKCEFVHSDDTCEGKVIKTLSLLNDLESF